jgi:hypothetical protein
MPSEIKFIVWISDHREPDEIDWREIEEIRIELDSVIDNSFECSVDFGHVEKS